MAAAAHESNSYEEIRRKRVEENLKHLEELGISTLSKGLLEVAQREYKSARCQTSPNSKKTFEVSELRRSSRARNPSISYAEEQFADLEPQHHRKRRSTCASADRAYTGRIASYKQIVNAVKRAEELQRDLKSQHPSFVKTMVRSHVSSCFWLGLPSKFCKDSLPVCEHRMVLEDEKGKEYDAIYIGKRTGLSGGWRGFALDHNLEDGDVLLFELTEPARFKIYIIKAIEEESSEAESNRDTPSPTAFATTTDLESDMPEEDLPVSVEMPPESGGRKQAQRVSKHKRKC